MLYTFSIHYRCRFQTPEEYDTTLLLSEDDDDDDSDTGVPANDIKISNSGVIKRYLHYNLHVKMVFVFKRVLSVGACFHRSTVNCKYETVKKCI